MHAFLRFLRIVVSRCWILPLCFLLPGGALFKMAMLNGVATTKTAASGIQTTAAIINLLWLASALGLVLWCVIFSVRDIAVHHMPLRALKRFLMTLLCGIISTILFISGVFAFMLADNDHEADDWTLPQGVELEVPQGTTLFGNYQYSDEIRQMVEQAEKSEPRENTLTLDEKGAPATGATPNFDKLTQEHPELPERLFERAAALEDTRMTTVKAFGNNGTCRVMLQCGDERVLPYDATIFETGGLERAKELRRGGNEWKLCGYCTNWGDDTPADDPQLVAAATERLDAALAPLAEAPTQETLDRLLPLPPLPCLRLSEGAQPGIFIVTVLLPTDAPEGRYTISATEYNTGTELGMRSSPLTRYKGQEFDYLRGEVTVYTGNWGQFYGSKWTVKDSAGKPILTRSFLIQGWSR